MTNKQDFKCEYCKKNLSTKYNLKVHQTKCKSKVETKEKIIDYEYLKKQIQDLKNIINYRDKTIKEKEEKEVLQQEKIDFLTSLIKNNVNTKS